MIEILEKYIKKGVARPGMKLRRFAGITLHEETGGCKQGAMHFAALLQEGARCKTRLSTHYFVDDNCVIQCIPQDEIAIHAGEYADYHTIAITMCDYEGCDYDMLLHNASELTAMIFAAHNITVIADRIYLHRQFSNFNRNCPKRFMEQHCMPSFAKTVQKLLLSMSNEQQQNSCGCDDTPTIVIKNAVAEEEDQGFIEKLKTTLFGIVCDDEDDQYVGKMLIDEEAGCTCGTVVTNDSADEGCTCNGTTEQVSRTSNCNYQSSAVYYGTTFTTSSNTDDCLCNGEQQPVTVLPQPCSVCADDTSAIATDEYAEEETPSEIIYRNNTCTYTNNFCDSTVNVATPACAISTQRTLILEPGETEIALLAQSYPPAALESESNDIEELIPYYGLSFRIEQ